MRSEFETPGSGTASKLYVLWQQPSTRAMIPVGILAFDGTSYTFEYVPQAHSLEGFRTLLGFRDFKQKYESSTLFPLFHERVLDPTRPDFARVVERLDLDPKTATPWEQLARSGGSSEGDTLQVTPFPHETSGGWECPVLVAGSRYLAKHDVQTSRGTTHRYSEEKLEEVLTGLKRGQMLHLEPEVDNPVKSHAQLFVTEDGDPVGWVPDWLAQLTDPCRKNGSTLVARVEHVNDARAGWHLRLLVRVRSDEKFSELSERIASPTVAA